MFDRVFLAPTDYGQTTARGSVSKSAVMILAHAEAERSTKSAAAESHSVVQRGHKLADSAHVMHRNVTASLGKQ